MREVAGLAVDAGALSRLRQQASADPGKAVREAASQFEALFMQQLLKSMREAIPRSGLMDGPGQSTYESMLDGQLAQSVSGQPGGLADMLVRQLSRHIDGGQPSADGARSAAVEPQAGQRRALHDLPRGNVTTVGGLPGPLANALGGLPPRGLSGGAGADPVAAASRAARAKASPAQVAFVDRMYPHARAAQRATGLPAEFIIGQAALESGWGRAEMKHPDGRPAHNLFGIKAGASWSGRTVDVLTTEYVDGEPRKSVEKFRAYDSYADAFVDWARLMKGSSRYGEVLRAGTSPEAFAAGLQRAGYATDPNYASKLERTIERTIELRRLRI